jgi:hypothetical protein
MSSAARTIQDAAEDAQREVRDLKPTKLTDQDFGRKHTQWHADFAAAIEELGAGADAMCTNLAAFSGQLAEAGQTYSANDSQATQNFNQ